MVFVALLLEIIVSTCFLSRLMLLNIQMIVYWYCLSRVSSSWTCLLLPFFSLVYSPKSKRKWQAQLKWREWWSAWELAHIKPERCRGIEFPMFDCLSLIWFLSCCPRMISFCIRWLKSLSVLSYNTASFLLNGKTWSQSRESVAESYTGNPLV